MDFLSMAKARYSCRSYLDDPIAQDVLDGIFEAGRIAPSAHNNQPWRVFALPEGSAALETVRTAGKIYKAPMTLVVCADREAAWERSFDGWRSTEVDASIITDHMMLAAAEQGVDSLWICWFDETIIRKALDLPENLVPVNILLLGYRAKEARPADRHAEQRLPIDQIVTLL